MGRPEWILIAVVLSLGLLGFAVVSVGPVQDVATTTDSTTIGSGPSEVDYTDSMAAGRQPESIFGLDRSGSMGALASAGTLGSVSAADSDRFLAPAQQEFERSTFRVRVDDAADARWTFRYERPIESEDDRSAFETYAERFRTEETDFYRDFRNRTDALTADASVVTGRSMTAQNVTRTAGIEQTPTQEVGYVELAFEWTNFGQLDGRSIVVGDVFEGGLYLGATQSLIFVAGEGVQFESTEPQGSPSAERLSESHSVTWAGERSFADRHPRIVYHVPGSAGGDGGVSMLWLLGGGVIGLLLVTVLVVARFGGIPSVESRENGAATATTAASTEDAPTANADTAAAASTPPAEPLSDERRVKELLEDRGGRMKQTEIVEATGWSKSKVSMLLSEMEADGEIRKIQIGRENIIALDGHEPDAATSPFDDAE